MECCSQKVKLIFVFDDPEKDYAYNLHVCELCGKLIKTDVWNNAGTTTLLLTGEVLHERNT